MTLLNRLAVFTALVIAAGEFARYWRSPHFFPAAFDELAVAAALLWAAWRAPRDGAGWHVAAWGGLCGLALVLLVETADHQLHGPAKANGPTYLVTLALLLVLGLWAVARAVRLVRR